MGMAKDNTNRPHDKGTQQTTSSGAKVDKQATGLRPGWAARQAAQPDPHRIIEK
jgi:hypothetical protein